ncbi:MAG: hypothetical protein ACLT1W_05680 [Alistipes onderdonkii]
MKGLFVVFHGFSAHSGISKKIFAQCDALRRNGADIELCHIEIAPDGTQRRMVGGQAIRTFGKGLRAKLEKRVSLSDITRYIRHEGVEFLYIRHDHNASPVLIHWLRKVKKLGVRIALEIPTYPYDAEFAQSPACGSSNCASTACSAAAWHAGSTASSPSPTIRKYSAARRSVYPTASTSGVSRSKPRYTGITTTYGCWPWRTSISGTASTA